MKYRVNPFIRIKFQEPIICELLLDGKELRIQDVRYLQLIAALKEPQEEIVVLKEIDTIFQKPQATQLIFEEITKNKIIVDLDTYQTYNLEGLRHWQKRNWLDALILHLKTKDLHYCDDDYETVENSQTNKHLIFQELVRGEESPEVWKTYSDIPSIKLPQPEILPDVNIEEVMLKRRSGKLWKNDVISVQLLSNILFHANKEGRELRMLTENSINANDSLETMLLSSFSALETYFFAFKIEGLSSGIYHYDLREHAVVKIKEGLFNNELVKMCIGQRMPRNSCCAFILTAIWKRYMFRYRHSRAYRNLLVNISELAHKYILLATGYNLSNWITPAFEDEYAESLLELNAFQEAPLYAIAIG